LPFDFGPFTKTLAITYRANGQKASLTYPNGDPVSFRYDAGGQLQTLATPGGEIGFQYQHGQPIRVTLPGAGKTLTYDRLSRLTGVTPPPSLQWSESKPTGLPVEGYSYDGVHNRLSSLHQPGPWVYNAQHQLLSQGLGDQAVTREYDANGHTIRIQQGAAEKRLAYDAAERLIAVTDANDQPIGAYQYDPFGRRTKKTTATDTLYYQYGDEGLIAEYDASGNTLATYGWQPNGMWGTNPQWKKEAHKTYFYSNDHLGTPQVLTDTAGQVVWKARVEAFGKTTVEAGATVVNNLRFPGQYFDAETGMHYNYFRDYEPGIGRYLQSDPIGLEGGENLYAYGEADSINEIDPTGEAVPLLVPYVRCVALCMAQSCIGGVLAEAVSGGGCSPPCGENLIPCMESCVNPLNWFTKGKGPYRGRRPPPRGPRPRQPGDCPPSYHEHLEATKDAVCGKTNKTCAGIARCAAIRMTIMVKCFRGGDKEHQTHAAQVWREWSNKGCGGPSQKGQ